MLGSIIGYTAYLWLLKTVELAKVSTNIYVNPVITVFMGWLVADENVTLPMLFATIVILAGVAVINTKLPHIGQKRQQKFKPNLEGISTE
ncbi:MAG: EamA family transporter [Anaerolineae bacterium]|nr:MAG: EamA family transporter [Anaerolineae bacterium]